MQKTIVLLLLISGVANGQTALHNFGNIQMHDNAEIGFHINLINDGAFNQNLGFVGFFNSRSALTISGTETPRFFDMEVDVENNLELQVNTEVLNSLTYTNGHVVTPRDAPRISLDFFSDAVYVFESNVRHTDGYTSYSGSNEFIFPIGDDNNLRPLITPIQNASSVFSAAYFNEDPNFPSTFLNPFDTSSFEDIISVVSVDEFWDFNGRTKTQVTLTWNSASNVTDLVDNLQDLRVVGWSIAEQRWLDLGNTEFTGNRSFGTITSDAFIPDEYDIITFGSLITDDELIVNNAISPNGDGVNDFFNIGGLELFNNNLKIYNRWQKLVFEADNYQNDWNGVSDRDLIASRDSRIPSGAYVYVLTIFDDNKNTSRTLSGYLYIRY